MVGDVWMSICFIGYVVCGLVGMCDVGVIREWIGEIECFYFVYFVFGVYVLDCVIVEDG